ncbi:phage portal protein [Priestia koreensis]|uniref:phage portal protein n=1 Tax=Priestia koreensis TaxID=284581 RepID=UPI003D07388C
MLFRKLEKRSENTYTLQDQEFAKMLGINLDEISLDKAKEATFFTCIKVLSNAISSLPLKLYKETEKGIEKADTHYLYNLLKLRPNPYMTTSAFLKAVEYQRNYYGHSIVMIDSDITGRVKALYPLDMSKVQILIDNAGIISTDNAIWYVFSTGVKEYRLKHDEVLHFHGMTNDGITGMAVKDYLKTTIENNQYAQDYTNRYFKGGLSAKGIVSYTGDLSADSAIRLKERLEKMATGMTNVGKILPLPIGFDYKAINATMADSQFVELQSLSMKQISNAFGVKPYHLGENGTFNNVQQQMEDFYQSTLQAILVDYEQEMTYKLLRSNEIKKGYKFEFNVDSLLRSDIKTRYEAYGIGIEKGFLSPNEARKKENLPQKEGADDLITNGNMQKIVDVGAYYKNDPSLKGGEISKDEPKTGISDTGNAS